MSANQLANHNLTFIVEEKFLSLIDAQEIQSEIDNLPLDAENYIRLANLYHFHKEFEKEEQILVRYTVRKNAINDELVEIYARLEKVSSLRHVQEKVSFQSFTNKTNLQLVSLEAEPEVVEMSSRKKLRTIIREEKRSLVGQTITALSVCAVYTGKTEEDELLQLALVLFQYQAGEEERFKILGNYVGNRQPKKEVSDEIYNRFNIKPTDLQTNLLDANKVKELFEKADYVISHNNSEVERRLICLLYPEIRDSKWYSTQKDIPWRALGFDSKSLSELSRAVGKPTPRTSSERALAICLLLQQEEPYADYPFIERIYYMRPMREIVWTPKMQKRHKQLTRKISIWAISLGLTIMAIGLLATLIQTGIL